MQKSQCPSRLRGVLIASLALNLFFAGLLATSWLKEPPHGPPRGDQFVRQLRAALPESDRPTLDQVAATHLPRIKAAHATMKQARAEVAAAIASTPFDVDRLAKALDVVNNAGHGMAIEAQDAILDIVPKLSPEGRVRLVEVMPPPPGEDE